MHHISPPATPSRKLSVHCIEMDGAAIVRVHRFDDAYLPVYIIRAFF